MKMKQILTIVLAVIFSMAISGQVDAKKKKDRCDLKVISLSVSSSAEVGDRLKIRSKIKNIGKSRAKASYTTFYLSKNSKVGSSDVYLGKVKFPSLKKKKKSKMKTAFVNIPADQPAGVYWLIAMADGKKKIKERKEKNNYRKRRITIDSWSKEVHDNTIDPDQTNTFTYDSTMNVTKEEQDIDGDGSTDKLITYTYDNDGNMDSALHESVDAQGNKTPEKYSTYADPTQNAEYTIRESYLDYIASKGGTNDFTYYSNDKIKRAEYDVPSIGSPEKVVYYLYDNDWNLVKVIHDNDDDDLPDPVTAGNILTDEDDEVITYEYDAQGHVTKEVYDDDNDGNVDKEVTYTYDSDGNKETATHTIYDFEGTPTVEKTVYYTWSLI